MNELLVSLSNSEVRIGGCGEMVRTRKRDTSHGATGSTLTTMAWCGDRARDHGGAAGWVHAVAADDALPVAEGIACHRGDLLDGRDALPATAIRLHCEAEIRSKQSETFKVMERRLLRGIIEPGGGRDLGARTLARLELRASPERLAGAEFALVVVMSAMHRPVCALVRDFAADRNRRPPSGSTKSSTKPDPSDDPDRDPGGGEAVLTLECGPGFPTKTSAPGRRTDRSSKYLILSIS